MTRIVIIQGHPDAGGGHLCHALASAYQAGAEAAGHDVKTINIAEIDFPLLRTQHDFIAAEPPAAIVSAQTTLRWGEHWVLVYPIWLGDMPALLKGFFEQTLRPGFAHHKVDGEKFPTAMLKGRSARVVVTMGMPALIYRWFYGAHSVKSLVRNILKFSGIKPVRTRFFGMVEMVKPNKRESWLEQMRQLGQRAR